MNLKLYQAYFSFISGTNLTLNFYAANAEKAADFINSCWGTIQVLDDGQVISFPNQNSIEYFTARPISKEETEE